MNQIRIFSRPRSLVTPAVILAAILLVFFGIDKGEASLGASLTAGCGMALAMLAVIWTGERLIASVCRKRGWRLVGNAALLACVPVYMLAFGAAVFVAWLARFVAPEGTSLTLGYFLAVGIALTYVGRRSGGTEVKG